MNKDFDLLKALAELSIDQEIEVSGVAFRRAEGGYEIDEEFVPDDELEEFVDIMFHYDKLDNQD